MVPLYLIEQIDRLRSQYTAYFEGRVPPLQRHSGYCKFKDHIVGSIAMDTIPCSFMVAKLLIIIMHNLVSL